MNETLYERLYNSSSLSMVCDGISIRVSATLFVCRIVIYPAFSLHQLPARRQLLHQPLVAPTSFHYSIAHYVISHRCRTMTGRVGISMWIQYALSDDTKYSVLCTVNGMWCRVAVHRHTVEARYPTSVSRSTL